MWLSLSPYSLLSLLVGVIAQILGLYVLRRSPDSRTIRMIFLIAIIFTTGAVLDFLLLIAPNEDMALSFGRALVFTLVLVFAAYMYLAIMMLPRRYQEALEARKVLIWGFIIASALFCAWNVHEVHKDSYRLGHLLRGWPGRDHRLWTGLYDHRGVPPDVHLLPEQGARPLEAEPAAFLGHDDALPLWPGARHRRPLRSQRLPAGALPRLPGQHRPHRLCPAPL